jgi:DNA modification methylase
MRMMNHIENTVAATSATTRWASDAIILGEFRAAVQSYLQVTRLRPLLILGDASDVLRELPDSCVDAVMTSPPYWGKREYANGGIGLETDFREFVCHLVEVFSEMKRVLKPTGSFWLNIGDSYQNKSLVGIPWRVAFELTDRQGWILRNSIIWNKVKSGMDNTKDRLGNVHETVFHFVKQPSYYYNADAIRSKPRETKEELDFVWDYRQRPGSRWKRSFSRSKASYRRLRFSFRVFEMVGGE